MFFIKIEDSRTVLSSGVRALTIQGCRVMYLPKYIEQLLVGDLFGVILDENGFCVAGSVSADLLVGGFFCMAARVSCDC